MKELAKIIAEVLFAGGCVFCASVQRCIDVVRESVFDIAVIVAITAVGVKLVEWATHQ